MEATRCGACGADADSAALLLAGVHAALCAPCLLRARDDFYTRPVHPARPDAFCAFCGLADRPTATVAASTSACRACIVQLALAVRGDPSELRHATPIPPDPYPPGVPRDTPAVIGKAIVAHAVRVEGPSPLFLGELFRYLGDALHIQRRDAHARAAWERARALLARYDDFHGDPRSEEARGRRALGAVFINLGRKDPTHADDLLSRAIAIYSDYLAIEARAARNYCIAHYDLAAARMQRDEAQSAIAPVEEALARAHSQFAAYEDAALDGDVVSLESMHICLLRSAKRYADAVRVATEAVERREAARKDASSLRAERRAAIGDERMVAGLPRPRFCTACDAMHVDVDVLVEGVGGALCDRCLRRGLVRPARGELREQPCSFCGADHPAGGIVVEGFSATNACARCTERLREHLVRHPARAAAVVWITPDVERVACAFCEKLPREVRRLSRGTKRNICDECVSNVAEELVAVDAAHTGPYPGWSCSFCDATSNRYLVGDARAAICDRCIARYQEA